MIMHYSSVNRFAFLALCTLNPALLLSGLIVLSPHTTASSLNHLHPIPQLPPQVPQRASHISHARSWLSHTRDSLVQTIWCIPPRTRLIKANGKAAAVARPPPTLLARYGGDLVLRFDISSIDEADALTQAINVLFLDVWEFTADWVDIRLSKDVVSSNRHTGIKRYLH